MRRISNEVRQNRVLASWITGSRSIHHEHSTIKSMISMRCKSLLASRYAVAPYSRLAGSRRTLCSFSRPACSYGTHYF